MKRSIVLFVLTILSGQPALVFGQGDGSWTSLWVTWNCHDRWCQECVIAPGTGLFRVYVTHEFPRATIGVRFRLVADPGLNFTYLSEMIQLDDTYIHGYSGNTQDGITIDCTYDRGWDPLDRYRVLLATVDYFATVAPEECAALRFASHPDADSGSIEIQGYDFVWRPPTYIFDLEVFPCGGWCAWATENSTWGAIKALY